MSAVDMLAACIAHQLGPAPTDLNTKKGAAHLFPTVYEALPVSMAWAEVPPSDHGIEGARPIEMESPVGAG